MTALNMNTHADNDSNQIFSVGFVVTVFRDGKFDPKTVISWFVSSRDGQTKSFPLPLDDLFMDVSFATKIDALDYARQFFNRKALDQFRVWMKGNCKAHFERGFALIAS